jgi:predicted HicB family RNase H-like nuclease
MIVPHDSMENTMPKFIIDGKTYNTATATAAAEYSFQDDRERDVDATVYRTRSGHFFIVYKTDTDAEHYKVEAEAITKEELGHVMENRSMEVLDEDALEAPAEEDAKEETIYLRVSKLLKDKITAKAGEKSINAWATQCLEKCVSA